MANGLRDLQNPELYSCKIFSYHKGHGRLYIHVGHLEDKDNSFFYMFRSVHYFAGQLYFRWTGAYFSIASDKEMLKVARRLEHMNHRSDEYIVKSQLRLYKIKLPQDTTLILAGDVRVTDSTNY